MAHRLGINFGGQPTVAAMGLGGLRDGVSPLDMARAYATIAAGGVYSKPMAIKRVVLADGKVDSEAGWGKPDRKRVIPDWVAAKVTTMLEQNIQYGTGYRTRRCTTARPRARPGRPRSTRTPGSAASRRTCDDRLDRLPERASADDERARHLRRRRHVPGADLARVHGRRARRERPRSSSRRRRARGTTLLVRARPLPARLRPDLHRADVLADDAATTTTPATTTTASTPAPTTPKRRTTRKPPPTPAPTTTAAPPPLPTAAADDDRPPSSRRRRPRRRLAESSQAPAARGRGDLGARRGLRRFAWPAYSPLVPLQRRPPVGDRALALVRSSPARRPPSSPTSSALAARPPRRAPRPRRSPRSRRDPARAARRAAAALDRRVDVLGLRPPRRGARRRTRTATARRRRRPTRRSRTSARTGVTRRSVYGPAFTLASEPVALAAGSSAGRGGVDLQVARRAGRARRRRCSPRGSRGGRRFALAFVGWNPLLAVHFAGGGHNDAWMAALVLGALALGVARPRQWAGVAWARRSSSSGCRCCCCRCARSRRARPGGASAISASRLTAAALVAVATWRYGSRWLGVGAVARNADRETTFALPHRLAQLGVPHALASALRRAFALAYVWLLREAARGRARLGLATGAAAARDAVLVVWYVVWTVPLAAAEDDEPPQWLALGLCAYLLRRRSRSSSSQMRRKSRTPSCSKTSRHAGSRRSLAMRGRVGSGASRSG